jgi:imidazolonepropionase-like amidohydrolase
MLHVKVKRYPGSKKFAHCLLSLLMLLTVVLSSSTCPTAQAEQSTVLVGGTLIDGNGGAPLPDAVVVIRGNKIVAVGKRGNTNYPKSAKIIDVAGSYVLPGLLDIHIHYQDWMGELFLAHGVTTVKDLGNVVEWISAVSADVDSGRMRGPRIFYVGNGLDAPPPARESHVGVDNPEMARAAVRLLHSRGACAIKIREKVTPQLVTALVDEAHKLGMPVTGHIRRLDAREAALAGIDGLEHASGVVQLLSNRGREIDTNEDPLQSVVADLNAFATIEDSKLDELAKLLAKRNVAIIPTMAGWWRMASARRDDFAREDTEYAKNQSLAYVPEDVRKLWSTSFIYNIKNADDLAQLKVAFKKLQYLLLRLHQAGGKVLAGSDTVSSVPGLSLQRELLMLVDVGFTPLQAITMATRDSARFLGRGAELGSVERGKLADILVLHANPIADIRNINQISLVIKDGQLVDTTYHPNYSIPTPKPRITRPVWLERELQRVKQQQPQRGLKRKNDDLN